MKKIFPIKTDTACLLKWAWSTVYFNSGTSASCHRTQKYKIDPENFDQFHNLPDKIQARELMLQGEWPGHGCEYCKNIEDAAKRPRGPFQWNAVTGVSDRQFNLQQNDHGWLIPPELDSDPTATAVTPTILEVYFKNTCNMKCVYCGPHFSSLWEEENRKFGQSFALSADPYDIKREQNNTDYEKMVSDLWRYLAQDHRYKKLRRYHVLGGEPFLMSELDASMEFWRQHPNPDLIFSIISNLNIPTKRFEEYIRRFEKLVLGNKIWKLQLTASLDCWGPEQEYVRYGLDLDLWQQNFELLLNRPWITVSINSAISALTIKSMPQLIERINHWNTKQTATAQWHQRDWAAEPILHSFNTSNEYDNPYIFGPDVFGEDLKHVLDLMPKQTRSQQAQHEAMTGIRKRIFNSRNDPEKINRLKTYLDVLDQRRNTNWRQHFSWLDREFRV